jgi:hypothetical protein
MNADDIVSIYAANAILLNVILLAIFLTILALLRHGFFALIILLVIILYLGTHVPLPK